MLTPYTVLNAKVFPGPTVLLPPVLTRIPSPFPMPGAPERFVPTKFPVTFAPFAPCKKIPASPVPDDHVALVRVRVGGGETLSPMTVPVPPT